MYLLVDHNLKIRKIHSRQGMVLVRVPRTGDHYLDGLPPEIAGAVEYAVSLSRKTGHAIPFPYEWTADGQTYVRLAMVSARPSGWITVAIKHLATLAAMATLAASGLLLDVAEDLVPIFDALERLVG